MEMKQLDLFSQPAAVINPDGVVCTNDQIWDTIEIGDHRTGLRIELAKHEDKWMWGTEFHTPTGGCGYRVGPKWGNFADTLRGALVNGCDEIRTRAKQFDGGSKVVQLLGQVDQVATRCTQ